MQRTTVVKGNVEINMPFIEAEGIPSISSALIKSSSKRSELQHYCQNMFYESEKGISLQILKSTH